ncbi:MAG: polyprenyl synthetase family protein [Polyangiaceae bacterium]
MQTSSTSSTNGWERKADMGEGESSAAFKTYAQTVKAEIDHALAAYFEAFERTENALPMAGELAPAFEALKSLVLRGGKRLRGVLLAAAFEASGGGDRAPIMPALVGFELLQAYLLIHDDWMDGDLVRRGGPTVHAALREVFGTAEGDAQAILTGDLAQALALEAITACAVPAERIGRAAKAVSVLLRNVTLGQMLDVRGAVARYPERATGLDHVYERKTASYTVTGPLEIGALLAGATDERVARLGAVARPLGILFQLRDDVLGVFGDPAVTGKSASSDLRQGKFTALVVEASAVDPTVAGDLAALREAPEDAVETLVTSLRARIVAAGARERVEARIERLGAKTLTEIEAADLTPRGRELLEGAAAVIGGRTK